MLELLVTSPIIFLFVASSLVISISIHEFSHALAADLLGDSTAKYLGRLTLNPAAHLDKVGTLFLIFLGFGWGKPVPFNPINLKNPRRDAALISFAGPLSNFLLAVVLAFMAKLFVGDALIYSFLYLTISYNLMLGFFNLIPVSPLDGFKIVNGILPFDLAIQWQQTESFGVFILLLLVITDSFSKFISPLVSTTLHTLGLS